jgi:integrase
MEQYINLQRNHTGACVHGYREPLKQGQKQLPDCQCPIVADGYLRNELGENGKPSRLRHKSTGAKDWDAANAVRDNWLKWGRTSDPGNEALNADPTIEEAITAYNAYKAKLETAGKQTMRKYKVLFKRLRTFCTGHKFGHIGQFGHKKNALVMEAFFLSWTNLRNPLKQMSLNTKRAEIERLKSFFSYCYKNGWVEYNHAADLKAGKSVVSKKVAWTMDEYKKIVDTFLLWEDEYGRMDTPKAKMVNAFALALRYTGQRLSDVAMLGPSNIVETNGKFFIELTQIKTGENVLIPVPAELVETLKALPFRGVRSEPFILKCQGWTNTYPAQGYWFWTGVSDLAGNANNWSMDVKRVLDKCEEINGKFKHVASAHTFRHFFAIQMISNGVSMEQVSRWLGHSDVKITRKHYSNANDDYNNAAYDAYMAAMERMEPKPKKTAKVLAMRKAG